MTINNALPKDSTGVPIQGVYILDSLEANFVSPDSWPHVYGYTSGLLTTDQITAPHSGNVFIKTYTYTGTVLTSETGWVKQ